MTERLVKFTLLGQEHALYTAASDEEMAEILALVRSLTETGSANHPGTLPIGRIAVLACLNIASRYVRLEREYAAYRLDSERRLGRLNEQISAGLQGE
jgi:hypothetical protein